jgi:hypothetical protein
MVDAIRELRGIVKVGVAKDIIAAIDTFKSKATGILDARELAGEVTAAESMLTALSYAERLERGEPLPALAAMPDGGSCYYREHAWLERARGDADSGQLDITDKGIFYDGTKRLTIPWSKVLTLSTSDRSLLVHRTSGGEPYCFDAGNDGSVRLAHLVALTIWKQQPEAKISSRRTRSKQSGLRPASRTAEESDSSPTGSTIELPAGGGSFSIQVVGESHCQAALRAFGGERRLRGEFVSFAAALVPDPKNVYDPNAIGVYIAQGGPRVGYLSREDAVDYGAVGRALTTCKAIGLCRAKLIGGTSEKPSIGVVLDLADPETTLAAITGTVQPF